MARVHRSYRLEESIVERVTAWAEEHHTTVTTAIEVLVTRAMDSNESVKKEDPAQNAELEDLRREIEILEMKAEAWQEQKTILGDTIATLKETVYTLKGQLQVKDGQIQRMQDAVDHAQALEAAHVGRYIDAHGGTQPGGVWGWLARKIGNGQ